MPEGRILATGKKAAKATLRLVGRAVPGGNGPRVAVLCYHSIHPTLAFRTTTPEVLSQHLAWVRQNCECVPLGDVLSAAQAPKSRRPVVSITFDDGYADNYEFAFPLLLESGLHATFFVTAGLLERDRATLAWFERLRRVPRGEIRTLEWAQAGEILDAGMGVGAHSYSHPNLARLDHRGLRQELERSKHVIEDRLGEAITTMAYPFGRPRIHVTQDVVEAAGLAGYELACTVAGRGVREGDDPLRLPRIFVTHDPVEVLRDKILGVWDLIGVVRERVPLAVSKVLSPSDFAV